MDHVELIASVCHAVNRAYCAATGDPSQPTWQDAPEWQKASAVAGVRAHLAKPGGISPAESHASWLAMKTAEGWAWGETKDVERKLHPCFLPYDQLPAEQRVKDHLFAAVVAALR
jgi:hypothetical protein